MDVFLIKKFYEGLDRGEKGKFLLWLQATLEISQTTAITRINSDGWRNVERDAVMTGIDNGTWKQ
jgi:hypothetical protein